MNFGLKRLKQTYTNVVARTAVSATSSLMLNKEDFAGLVKGVAFKNPLDFEKDGYEDAGNAIGNMTNCILEFYAHDESGFAEADTIMHTMRELGDIIAQQVYKPEGSVGEMPTVLFDRIIRDRNVINTLLDSKINHVMVDISEEFCRCTTELAGFSQGLTSIARKFSLGPFADKGFKDDFEPIIDWFMEQKTEQIAKQQPWKLAL